MLAGMKIDFVSDVSCPWCAIGLHALEQALDRVRADGISATLHLQPFELNPAMPPEGEEIVGHLTRKYGITPEQVAANTEAIRQRGASVGFTFGLGKRSRIWNTFDAHRLLHWAGIEGGQRALKHALLQAYFSEGRNVSDHATLVDIAGGAGFEAERAQAILASNEYAAEVREAERFFTRNGINGVPAVIIERKHLVSGGQPVEVFERALREIAAGLPG